jgi:DNA polymerase III subunit delta
VQITAAQLPQQLARGLKSLYTVHGDEGLLQQEAADVIRAAARAQGHSERTVHVVQGAHFNWGEVQAAASAQSLFADKQLVELRIPSGKPGKEGSVALQTLAEQTLKNADTLILVLLPKLDFASLKTAWFAALDGNGVCLRLEPVERPALPQWIAQRLKAQGQSVPAGDEGQRALQFFADCVEGNLLAAHQEVQKLALLHPAGELSLAQIEAAVLHVARYDVFKLSESVLAGKPRRVQRMLDGLQAEGVAEVLVHWSLSEDIRALFKIRQALDAGRPLPMALREAKVWGAKEKLYERVIPKLSATTLGQLLQAAHTTDGLVKGIKHPAWPLDAWAGLHKLAASLTRACSSETPRQ